MLHIFVALFFAMLLAPASALDENVNNWMCAGTIASAASAEPGWYRIGDRCTFEPGKASKTILAVCHEGDTCIVHAFGEITIRTDVVLRSQTTEGVGIDGRSLGNGTAFSAVAPSERPVCDAHRSNIREVVSPPGPNSWPPNIPGAWSVPRALRLSI